MSRNAARELLIEASVYTGCLLCPFDKMHRRIEELMERPVWTHEMGDRDIMDEVKRRSEPRFRELCALVWETEVDQ